MWGQSEKSIAAWIERIINKRIQSSGLLHFLTLHHLPTLEAPTHPTKINCSYKNFTQLDSLPSKLLYDIYMRNEGLVQCNQLKPVLL